MTMRQRLSRACRRGAFTLDDVIAALDWILTIKPRADRILALLRHRFVRAVMRNDTGRAAGIYTRIRLRRAI